MTNKGVVFNIATMNNLVESDMYLAFVKKDLSKRNPSMPKEEVLEIVFNSNVLDSLEYMSEYYQHLQRAGK
jgi:hypothetical protein